MLVITQRPGYVTPTINKSTRSTNPQPNPPECASGWSAYPKKKSYALRSKIGNVELEENSIRCNAGAHQLKAASEVKLDPSVRDLVSLLLLLLPRRRWRRSKTKVPNKWWWRLGTTGQPMPPSQNPTQKHQAATTTTRAKGKGKTERIIEGYVSHHRAPDLRGELMLPAAWLTLSFTQTQATLISQIHMTFLSPKHKPGRGALVQI